MPGITSFDQSFCKNSLERVLWKRDFRGVPKANQKAFRESLVSQALVSATNGFAPPSKPLTSFPLRGKTVYRLTLPQDELVVRKLRSNLKHCKHALTDGRSQIVKRLLLLLEEGVPYRIYRLDIRSFFESFERQHVRKTVNSFRTLGPQSKSLIEALLSHHSDLGGSGIPRGLSVSAVLSELLMQEFDQKVRWAADTFFFARYVDDIIAITSARESTPDFLAQVCSWLPPGLTLNPKKREIVEAPAKISKVNAAVAPELLSFDYLGYKFSVRNPTKLEAAGAKDGELFRSVNVDIATKKLKRIKTRLIRSFLDYATTNDWELLRDRIAFLTQNFSVYNPKAGGKKIAGIYYSYPLVTLASPGLKELDDFLRNAVLAKHGRVFIKTSPLLDGKKRRALLGYSFVRGHTDHSFVHFSPQRISAIQNCWLN